MRSVFLVGPKHAGKSSAGRALASRCGGRFIDLDEVIARQSGKSPRALYAGGPDIFRKAEAAALASLLVADAGGLWIIAAGGGIIDNPLALVLLDGTDVFLTVYLEVAPETAWERISGEGELPPFLRTEDPQAAHRALHERRAAAYRRFARLCIAAEGKTPEEIAQEIISRMETATA